MVLRSCSLPLFPASRCRGRVLEQSNQVFHVATGEVRHSSCEASTKKVVCAGLPAQALGSRPPPPFPSRPPPNAIRKSKPGRTGPEHGGEPRASRVPGAWTCRPAPGAPQGPRRTGASRRAGVHAPGPEATASPGSAGRPPTLSLPSPSLPSLPPLPAVGDPSRTSRPRACVGASPPGSVRRVPSQLGRKMDSRRGPSALRSATPPPGPGLAFVPPPESPSSPGPRGRREARRARRARPGQAGRSVTTALPRPPCAWTRHALPACPRTRRAPPTRAPWERAPATPEPSTRPAHRDTVGFGLLYFFFCSLPFLGTKKKAQPFTPLHLHLGTGSDWVGGPTKTTLPIPRALPTPDGVWGTPTQVVVGSCPAQLTIR